MNLRTKFIWNVLIFMGLVTLGYSGYHLYDMYTIKTRLWDKYTHETTGSDEKLTKYVHELENRFVTQLNYKFKIMDVPTDLTKVIAIDGSDYASYGVSSIRFSAGITGKKNHAIAQYHDQTFHVTVGDSIAGGVVKEITPDQVVFVRDGETFYHLLSPKIEEKK